MQKYIILLTVLLVATIAIYALQEDVEMKPKNEKFQLPPRPEHVDDRQWHRIKMRGGKLEPNKIIKGREIAAKMFDKKGKSSQLKDAGLNQWNWKGPSNIAGRARAIIAKNTTAGGYRLILGAAAGGIWTSEDEGQNWSPC